MSKRGSGSSTRASSEKTTLDEFLAKRGLSSPISDYMDDKMRIPHGLTRRQTEKNAKGSPRGRCTVFRKARVCYCRIQSGRCVWHNQRKEPC